MNVDPRSFFAEPARLHPRETRDLDVGREEHAANLTTDGVGRQVLLELGADDTRGTVRAHNLTPNRAVLRPLLLRLRLVHVAQLLTAVKGRRRAVVHALELDERRVVVLVGARALVTKNHAADVQSVEFKKKSGVSLSSFQSPSAAPLPGRANPLKVDGCPSPHRRRRSTNDTRRGTDGT